jgi:hypothetical protein
MSFTDSDIDQTFLDWFTSLGYAYAFGPDIAIDGQSPSARLIPRSSCSIAYATSCCPISCLGR